MDFRLARARHLRLGRRGEAAACRYLHDRGGEVLLRNYRPPAGEIDIIARDGLTLCFIEVKSRRASAAARPAAGLSRRQQRRIRRAALTYLREIGRPRLPWRFDLVEVVFGPWDIRELRHWRGHFSGRREEGTRWH
jgi:putative endonuclease